MHYEEHYMLYHKYLLAQDNTAYCVIHSVSSMTQQSTGRHIGDIILDTTNQFLILLINTACLNNDRAALSIL